MKYSKYLLLVMFLIVCQPMATLAQTEDWRNIQNGRIILDESYSDQPHNVKTDDGAWLCIMTNGPGHEG